MTDTTAPTRPPAKPTRKPITADNLPKVFVGLPTHTSQIEVEFADAFQRLCVSGLISNWQWLQGDSLINRARNLLARQFLESDCDYLLFLDTDLRFEPEQIASLIKSQKDLVAGIYPCKEITPRYPTGCRPDSKKEGHLIAADYLPTGCMLIHRSVFEAIIRKMPEIEYRSDDYLGGKKCWAFFQDGIFEDLGQRRHLSEDYAFCKYARDCGIQPWLDSSVTCYHIGRAIYPIPAQLLDQALAHHERNGYQRQPAAPKPLS